MTIYVDGDGCSVREETYKVALRYQIKVIVVANHFLNTPNDELIEIKIVSNDFDSADDWIVDQIGVNDLIVTSDLLLADRCIKKGALVLGPKGKEINEENIGGFLANREFSAHLRQLGDLKTGPSPMNKNDRSNFLSNLDRLINKLK